MTDIEHISINLQSGVAVRVDAWPGSDAAQPIVIVAPGTTAEEVEEPAGWDLTVDERTVESEPASMMELDMLRQLGVPDWARD